MKFSPGDKVSFVNEKQEGIVKGYRGKMVLVDIEDGFEIPANEAELVKIISVERVVKPSSETEEKIKKAETSSSDILSVCEPGTVTVVAIPAATGAVLSGTVNYYLVNRSLQQLLFVFYSREKETWKGLQFGIIATENVVQLFSFERTDLINIQSFLLNGIFHIEESESYPAGFRKEFTVMVPNLQSANKNLPGLLSFAQQIVVYAPLMNTETKTEDKDLETGIKELKQQFGKQSVNKPVKHQQYRPGTIENEKEVDLHIEELTDTLTGLSNSEMLQIQLSRFQKEMDTAIRNHYRRIVFIHGVGNGKLKQEIRKELQNYKGITYQDADSRKYGRGATEVNFI